ncbi:hypothetical protein NDU88_003484 [Pleurodeles waltl]|uniref:Uncharacterized protein n=1 Tax=Pleurodeles waltl TaxID=8319 RepID=A0AAV7SDR7_PLEWA|nr:hypothetical protein NDU88_003484 [Pleurodeles waltl]
MSVTCAYRKPGDGVPRSHCRQKAGAAEAWSRTNDTEHLGVLKPEREKVRGEPFSPGREETRTENGTEGGVLTRNA